MTGPSSIRWTACCQSSPLQHSLCHPWVTTSLSQPAPGLGHIQLPNPDMLIFIAFCSIQKSTKQTAHCLLTPSLPFPFAVTSKVCLPSLAHCLCSVCADLTRCVVITFTSNQLHMLPASTQVLVLTVVYRNSQSLPVFPPRELVQRVICLVVVSWFCVEDLLQPVLWFGNLWLHDTSIQLVIELWYSLEAEIVPVCLTCVSVSCCMGLCAWVFRASPVPFKILRTSHCASVTASWNCVKVWWNHGCLWLIRFFFFT